MKTKLLSLVALIVAALGFSGCYDAYPGYGYGGGWGSSYVASEPIHADRLYPDGWGGGFGYPAYSGGHYWDRDWGWNHGGWDHPGWGGWNNNHFVVPEHGGFVTHNFGATGGHGFAMAHNDGFQGSGFGGFHGGGGWHGGGGGFHGGSGHR